MKRSEMVRIIKHAMDELGDIFTEDEASKVLLAIENAGMLKCEKRDLGSIGKLWTPEGWEPEAGWGSEKDWDIEELKSEDKDEDR